VLVLEGSGQAIPPVHADATICVVPADGIRAITEGLGPYRVLLSDLVVITMVEAPFADSGAAEVEASVRGVAPGVRVARIGLRPFPLEPVSGRTVFYVTTAPASAIDSMARHLEREHGCTVVGTSPHLAQRPKLAEDLDRRAKPRSWSSSSRRRRSTSPRGSPSSEASRSSSVTTGSFL